MAIMNHTLSKFLQLDRGLSAPVAYKLSTAYLATKDCSAILAATFFTKNSVARIYYELWSQNKLPAIAGLQKCYYDAIKDNIFVKFDLGFDLSILSIDKRFRFSGSKTKKRFIELQEITRCLRMGSG